MAHILSICYTYYKYRVCINIQYGNRRVNGKNYNCRRYQHKGQTKAVRRQRGDLRRHNCKVDEVLRLGQKRPL
jgi:hypothetical protein